MTRILFNFVIYPSCERTLKSGRVKSKIVRKSSFGDMAFWVHMITYDYFSSVYCIVPKKVLFLKYRKWVTHLKNRYHYAKVVENARIHFSVSPYCTLLFSRKENWTFKRKRHWTFTCFSKTVIKALKQDVKFVQT